MDTVGDGIWMAVSNKGGAVVRAKVPEDFVKWIREQNPRIRTALAIRMTLAVKGLLQELQALSDDRILPSDIELRRADLSIANFGPSSWTCEIVKEPIP